MANILDYLDWRGDIGFEASPFNEVDNLLVSELSYVDFGGIVPGLDTEESVSIEEAANRYFANHDIKEVDEAKSLVGKAPLVLKKMAESKRFQNRRLELYVNHIDEQEEMQFSAIVMDCSDGSYFVAFRGTDDTLVGWKEDFNMSYISAVPSQLEAVKYLEMVAKLKQTPLRVGGHSKGGNLAVYAAVNCSDIYKKQILEVFNNDGPGFSKEMITSDPYLFMRERIKTIVPQSSVVGMLLEHEEEYLVTKSSQTGFMQHDPLSWMVLGTKFVYLESTKKESKILDKTLKNWINEMTEKEREDFVMALFHVLYGTGAKNLSDLSEDRLGNLGAVFKTAKVVKTMKTEDQEMMAKVIKSLIKTYKDVFLEELPFFAEKTGKEKSPRLKIEKQKSS